MPEEKSQRNARFLGIIGILRAMRNKGAITNEEYRKAKAYYEKLTETDLILSN